MRDAIVFLLIVIMVFTFLQTPLRMIKDILEKVKEIDCKIIKLLKEVEEKTKEEEV